MFGSAPECLLRAAAHLTSYSVRCLLYVLLQCSLPEWATHGFDSRVATGKPVHEAAAAVEAAERDAFLLRAVVANHRRWFQERGEGSCVAEPGADANDLVRMARERGSAGLGVWSAARNDALGVRLVARGFDWGWRPHWMAIDLHMYSEPEHASPYQVMAAEPPFAVTLPYADQQQLGTVEGAVHLGVRLREKIVGHVWVLPVDGVAGIYSMGVVPKVQRRGVGLALLYAALRVARQRGCTAAVLNATDAGRALYERAGFRSLGWGGTWWYKPTAEPSKRQIAIAEAIGLGDVSALHTLESTEAEIKDGRGGVSPLALAAVTGQVASLEYMLTRFPSLATCRFPPHGGTLLHVAVEHDRPEILDTALRLGVNPKACDNTFNSTAAGWARHLKRAYLQ